jgi:MFS family permease
MSPLRAAWRDYREALHDFSRPARLFLLHVALGWTGYGVNTVLFNLYLVQGGYQAAFVGRVISINGLGLALGALPAGWLAERWGRRPCVMLGAVLYGTGHLSRALWLSPATLLAGSLLAGLGQSLIAIAAAPFLTEHSTERERTHLFSAFFATELLAGVVGSLVGGWLPPVLRALPLATPPSLLQAYRFTLIFAALLDYSSVIPMLRLGRLAEMPLARERAKLDPREQWRLLPIMVNAFLIGAGAGLVIPFMNLYFKTRFDCSSAQIGVFFSVAQVATAIAMLLGPVIARRFGKLRTATASQLLSLPFLVTLGAEQRLEVAVGAFWLRAMLMQASTPLIGAFVMETVPPALRARSASFTNLVWNAGWAASATLSGLLIVRFGYAVPFYVTATLYSGASLWLYRSFRHVADRSRATPLSEEAKGLRGEGPMTE